MNRSIVLACALMGCAGPAAMESRDASDASADIDDVAPRDAGGMDGDATTMDAGMPRPDADAATDAPAPTDASDASDVVSAADAGFSDPLRANRRACEFHAGNRVRQTIGISDAERAAIPIRHVLIFMQENRSFDHYFGRMTQYGHDVDGFDASFTNPTGAGGTASPRRSLTTCIGPDIPHAWARMHDQWNGGANDGFFTNAAMNGNGQRALYWFDERDIPFYYWVYSHFALADRHFSSVLGPTWPNRDYLYAAQSDGVHNTDERIINVRTIFDALQDAGVSFREYATGDVRSHCAGRTDTSPGVVPLAQIWTDLSDGTLPRVAFIDVSGAADEHSVANVQDGEAFFRRLVLALFDSPQWPSSALLYTYDESGGFFDHVPPPRACLPDGRAANADFDRMGFRVPLLVVSPWARAGYVSHVVHEATSVTRFVELLHDLPALTDRDANSDALLDMFDFTAPSLMTPPAHPPAAGTGGCP